MKPPTHRLIHRDGEYLSWCSHCEQHLTIKNFSPTNRDHGFTYVCKFCVHKRDKQKSQERTENPEDLKLAHEVLKNIGYNPDSELSIHSQFLLKHFS
jgi:hypothetical protein